MSSELLIIGALVLAFVAAAVSVGLQVHSKRYRERPEVVLRRCRLELWAIKRELGQWPATREIHEIMKQIDATVHTADLVEAQMTGKQG